MCTLRNLFCFFTINVDDHKGGDYDEFLRNKKEIERNNKEKLKSENLDVTNSLNNDEIKSQENKL